MDSTGCFANHDCLDKLALWFVAFLVVSCKACLIWCCAKYDLYSTHNPNLAHGFTHNPNPAHGFMISAIFFVSGAVVTKLLMEYKNYLNLFACIIAISPFTCTCGQTCYIFV